MARAKNAPATRRRHKKYLKAAKGYFSARRKLYRAAREQVKRSWQYATKHRRKKKADFRRLWNARISAEAQSLGINYSRLIDGLRKSNIRLNRKSLSELAQVDKAAFQELVQIAKAAA